jgi:threonine aldolase
VPHPSLPSYLFEPHTLVCLENTHNEAGGTIWPLGDIEAITMAARDLGLATHLDGARLWNASAATGTDVAVYAQPFDSVSVCFSKGLGAPIGSALVGDAGFIAQARRFKQMFGGGFRQAGLLAAAALFALEHNRDRLTDDHENARRFALALSQHDSVMVDLASVQTNIVYFDVEDPARIVDACLEAGVAMLVLGPNRIRAVFHLDVSAKDTDAAIETVRELMPIV